MSRNERDPAAASGPGPWFNAYADENELDDTEPVGQSPDAVVADAWSALSLAHHLAVGAGR